LITRGEKKICDHRTGSCSTEITWIVEKRTRFALHLKAELCGETVDVDLLPASMEGAVGAWRSVTNVKEQVCVVMTV
jgi:hypothetical protein